MSSGIERATAERDGGNERLSITRFALNRKVLIGAAVVLAAIVILVATSRETTSATIPDLVGERVDPRFDGLRLRLAYEGLVLDDVSIETCPSLDVPGSSLEELPGTIIDQHPAAGTEVATSGAVDVTVCLPAEGS